VVGVAEKKKAMTIIAITFFCGIAKKKKTMATFVTFFGGFVTKKVTTSMLSPFSMVVVL
jgi:hypothetical protein